MHTGTGHITLQHLKFVADNPGQLAALASSMPKGISLDILSFLGQSIDALFQGTGHPLPPAIILDYSYGVAAYKCWRSRQDEVHSLMRSYCREHYTSTRRGDIMANAINDLNLDSMSLQEITPQEAANRREK